MTPPGGAEMKIGAEGQTPEQLRQKPVGQLPDKRHSHLSKFPQVWYDRGEPAEKTGDVLPKFPRKIQPDKNFCAILGAEPSGAAATPGAAGAP